MKAKILFSLFVIFSSYSYAQEDVSEKAINPQEWIEQNDIASIELYCRQQLFWTYGIYGDSDISSIDNKKAEKVITLLKYGANAKDANCQFMLACVLSGNKTIRAHDDEYNEIELPAPKDYKYLDDAKARKYFQLYLSNPKMDKEYGAFGYALKTIIALIENAYPDLVKLYIKREKVKLLRKMSFDNIENSTPRFGLG